MIIIIYIYIYIDIDIDIYTYITEAYFCTYCRIIFKPLVGREL